MLQFQTATKNRGDIKQLSEPKLPRPFVVGQYDEVRVETARDFQARVPGSDVRMVPDAGHGIRRDQPQAFSEAIVGSLSGIAREGCRERQVAGSAWLDMGPVRD